MKDKCDYCESQLIIELDNTRKLVKSLVHRLPLSISQDFKNVLLQTDFDWIEDKQIKPESEQALKKAINLNSIFVLKQSVDIICGANDFKQLRDQIDVIFRVLKQNSAPSGKRLDNLNTLEKDIKSYTFLIDSLFNIQSRQSQENICYDDMWN